MAGRAPPALPQYLTAMKREVKKAITRCRKAQDAVLNNMVEHCHCMSIDCSVLPDFRAWWTIFIHRDDDPEKCQSWRIADDDLGSIDKTMREIAMYLQIAV